MARMWSKMNRRGQFADFWVVPTTSEAIQWQARTVKYPMYIFSSPWTGWGFHQELRHESLGVCRGFINAEPRAGCTLRSVNRSCSP